MILDTKSDLEALTLNAYHAADRVLMPVADWSSLEEAGKAIAILERAKLGVDRARVVLTLVDLRTKLEGEGLHLVDRLLDEIERRGWPCYTTHLSRSPRVEMLNSGHAAPLSILHHARGSIVHSQMRDLAAEVLADLGLAAPETRPRRPAGLARAGGLGGRADGIAAPPLSARGDELAQESSSMSTYGILVGGGPAPGINGVIGAAATTAARSGARVVGIHDGFKWIMEGDTSHVRELDEESVAEHPPARRLDPGHLARESDQEARAPRELREDPRSARRSTA